MYAWIWRLLPGGLAGKLTGSLLLAAAAVSLLWFWVFPATAEWVEEFLLPFDQSTIGDGEWEEPSGGSDPGLGGDPGGQQGEGGPDQDAPADPHDIPYDTGG